LHAARQTLKLIGNCIGQQPAKRPAFSDAAAAAAAAAIDQ